MKFFYKFIFLLLFLFLPSFAYSCSLAVPRITKFNAYEYVFGGKVIGYTKPLKSQSIVDPAVGLTVEANEILYSPKSPKKYFEVFPYDLGADCSTMGKSRQELSGEFPVNSKVRVIAVESFYFPNQINQENLRLEVPVGEHLSVVRFDSLSAELKTSVHSIFDYRKVSLKDSRIYDVLNFELRKDLHRLEFSLQDSDRQKILERLIFYPSVYDIDFETLIKNYIKSNIENEREKLIQQRENFEKEKQKSN